MIEVLVIRVFTKANKYTLNFKEESENIKYLS